MEQRLARLAWSTLVGLGLVYLYAIIAPKYMGFYQPTLLERPEFSTVAAAGALSAALIYVVTRNPRKAPGNANVTARDPRLSRRSLGWCGFATWWHSKFGIRFVLGE